jgi:hypothetical protein
MRHLIPTLFIVLALSPYANASERLKHGSTTLKAEEIAYTSNLVRAAIFTHSNRYYQQGKIKSQHEAHDYMIKTAGTGRTQTVRNPLNCFNSLAPDFCWYTGPAKVSNTQPAVDLASENIQNPVPANEEVCSTVNQPCDNIYNQNITHINVAVGEKPARPKKTVSAGSQVKLDFFSISLIF